MSRRINCKEVQANTIDYLDNSLSAKQKERIDNHLFTCEKCRKELWETESLFKKIDSDSLEQPDSSLRIQFDQMLLKESSTNEKHISYENYPTRRSIPSVWKIAAGLVLILTGAYFGHLYYPDFLSLKNTVSESKSSTNGMTQTLMIGLQDEESSVKRIKTVNSIESYNQVDKKVLLELIRVLNTDQNVNVRVAAAYALSKFMNNQTVRDSLVASLGKQTQPVLQITLIQLLTENLESKALEPIQQIISNKKTLEQVKYVAKKSYNILI